MNPRAAAHFSAQALVPEQIAAYVEALSGSKALACASCAAYEHESGLVLIGYPFHDPLDDAALDLALAEACRLPLLRGGKSLTLLCAHRPLAAPPDALAAEDHWWSLDLPLAKSGQKVRNMLRRADRAVIVKQSRGVFDAAHQSLVQEQIRRRPLRPGTRFMYSRLPSYLAASPQALLFSAYDRESGELQGCAIGEYASLHTAFYQFAFRAPKAPPGTADLLLAALLQEAEARGHARCNLGLGLSEGISFFKRKWGAKILLPYREYSWTPHAKKWWKLWE